MEGQEIVVIVVVLLVLLGLAYLFIRRPTKPDIKAPPREAPDADPSQALKPTTRALEERMEVEGPVEIHEGMSLADIKRAKAARIKGNKGHRETAVEATESAKKEIAKAATPADVAEPVEAKSEAPAEPAAHEPVEDQPETPVEPQVETTASEVSEDISAGWDMLDIDLSGDDLGPTLNSIGTTPEPPVEQQVEPQPVPAPTPEPVEEPVEEPVGLDQMSESYATPLSEGLARTRTGFIDRLGKLFRKEKLDAQIVDEVEEVLYTADIGTRASRDIMQALEDRMASDGQQDPGAVWRFVRQYVEDLLEKREAPLDIETAQPFVILVVGVNGVGKTTTIGKMAAKFKRQGKRVLIVAGDTFRAAAVDQIEVWGDRADIPVHTGDDNADPSSVVYSGVARAKNEGFDVVICDTAGRLHTKAPLLDELQKMSRVTKKVIEDAPHETILVLDANTGQNAIQQAKMFGEAVEITGIVLTKLDGTAKGGVILGICDELDAPIRYIGIGESVADLRQFNAHEFAEALFM